MADCIEPYYIYSSIFFTCSSVMLHFLAISAILPSLFPLLSHMLFLVIFEYTHFLRLRSVLLQDLSAVDRE